MTSVFSSRFDRLSRPQAIAVIAAFACLIGFGIMVSGRAPRDGSVVPSSNAQGDLALYRSIVSRVRSGESYYATAAEELRTRNYALRPPLNFRLPTLAWTLAAFASDAAARRLLAALTWTAFSVWIVRFFLAGLRPAALAFVLPLTATGSFLGMASAGLYWHELWAGLFVMIALGLYGPRSWGWSAMAALVACLFRELALPLPLAMAAFALRERRFREAVVWMAMILVFALVLWAHLVHASHYVRAGDPANSWSALGGWAFVLSTARWNYFLIPAPSWVLAIVMPVALCGLVGWRHPVGARAAFVFAVWVTSFLFVGRPDNHYWGMLYSPVIAIGFALAPFSLLALVRRTAEGGRVEGAVRS
jgi:hypothetical protein